MKPDLYVRWSKRERALIYGYTKSKPCGGMLAGYFEPASYQNIGDFERGLVAELERRGYDITTLRFSIRAKAKP